MSQITFIREYHQHELGVFGRIEMYVDNKYAGFGTFRYHKHVLGFENCEVYETGHHYQVLLLEERLKYGKELVSEPIVNANVYVGFGSIASFKNVRTFAEQHPEITFMVQHYIKDCVLSWPKNVTLYSL